MRRRPRRAWISSPRVGVLSMLALSLTACNPTISVYGVYVPGWLVAGISGFVLSYVSVSVMARIGALRALSESGVFFCSMGAILAYIIWFTFFSRF